MLIVALTKFIICVCGDDCIPANGCLQKCATKSPKYSITYGWVVVPPTVFANRIGTFGGAT